MRRGFNTPTLSLPVHGESLEEIQNLAVFKPCELKLNPDQKLEPHRRVWCFQHSETSTFSQNKVDAKTNFFIICFLLNAVNLFDLAEVTHLAVTHFFKALLIFLLASHR